MKLITASNERYFPRIQAYLESLNENSQIQPVLVCVGERLYDHGLPCVDTVQLPRALNLGAPQETECPQHGSFLQVVDGEPDEVLIFTDGDIILQRPFSDDEMQWSTSLPTDTVACGYNSGPNETLKVEAERLWPRFPMSRIDAIFGLLDRPCYNIGVIVARRSTWERIYTEYMKHWQTVTDAMAHPARQQWLVVHTIHSLGIQVRVTPYSFHANGHYGMPPGCSYGDGKLYAGDDLVAFRHKL